MGKKPSEIGNFKERCANAMREAPVQEVLRLGLRGYIRERAWEMNITLPAEVYPVIARPISQLGFTDKTVITLRRAGILILFDLLLLLAGRWQKGIPRTSVERLLKKVEELDLMKYCDSLGLEILPFAHAGSFQARILIWKASQGCPPFQGAFEEPSQELLDRLNASPPCLQGSTFRAAKITTAWDLLYVLTGASGRVTFKGASVEPEELYSALKELDLVEPCAACGWYVPTPEEMSTLRERRELWKRILNKVPFPDRTPS